MPLKFTITLYFYHRNTRMFPYTVTHYPPLLGVRANVHRIVGKRDNCPDGHEDTLTIRFYNDRDNTLSIHMQCTDLLKIQTIREAFDERSSLTILVEAERGEYEPAHITHVPFFSNKGDAAIYEHLNLINNCVFNNKIPEQMMAILRQITGVSEVNPVVPMDTLTLSNP